MTNEQIDEKYRVIRVTAVIGPRGESLHCALLMRRKGYNSPGSKSGAYMSTSPDGQNWTTPVTLVNDHGEVLTNPGRTQVE